MRREETRALVFMQHRVKRLLRNIHFTMGKSAQRNWIYYGSSSWCKLALKTFVEQTMLYYYHQYGQTLLHSSLARYQLYSGSLDSWHPVLQARSKLLKSGLAMHFIACGARPPREVWGHAPLRNF